MPKLNLSLYKIFLIFLGTVLSFFLYAGLTGTRLLGDDTEKYEPSGPDSRGNTRVRTSRFYHK
ncbi:MAG: hypothetical protein ACO1OF_17435 [Adhaeribacter sp.]